MAAICSVTNDVCIVFPLITTVLRKKHKQKRELKQSTQYDYENNCTESLVKSSSLP